MTPRATGQFRSMDDPPSGQELKDLILSLPGNAHLLRVIDDEDKARLDKVRKDVAQRLKKACTHLADKDFDALVDKIAMVQLRGERSSR